MEKKFKVGCFDVSLNNVLGTSFAAKSIYQSKGLKTHMLKRKHYTAAQYIDFIPQIIADPDYIGKSGDKENVSIEYVKCYDDNIRLVVKADSKSGDLYVATMFELPQKKLDRFVHSGRLIKVID